MNEARLYEILGLKRGHGSIGEQLLIDTLISKYDPQAIVDPALNDLAYYVSVGEGSRTLFSCHIDTVHADPAKVGKLNKIVPFDENAPSEAHVNRMVRITDKIMDTVHGDGDVLGADDGAGVWLLLEMIDAGVPGHYLFHRGEECGGVGSAGVARYHAEFLQQFERAIAFDRRGTHSVVTHQRFGTQCCSDKFAAALASALTDDSYFFAPDESGVFTDTANYIGLIGECTNLSVGYYDEHTPNESLDLTFLFSLREKCISLKWDDLPTERRPEVEEDWFMRDIQLDDLYEMSYEQLLNLVEYDPTQAAGLMWEMMHEQEDETWEHDMFMDRLKVGIQ